MKTSQKKLIKAIVVSAVSLILIVALTIGNVISFQNFDVITSFLCGQGFKDNENTTAVRAKNDALAQKVEEAGAVMLKKTTASTCSVGQAVTTVSCRKAPAPVRVLVTIL